ncbi:DJ-1/PfpI family protein [Ferrovibrio sp.]|uniref:DJ-1/PfpI family protein n=1 Tax=Ferrovibrio sp. TaxID=1917215 RepID=UPI00260C9EE8|nr:DJ-1/PfpI family protein [Ferrovibrio sp.]
MRFGFLMYPGYEELDMIGPWEIATMWKTYAAGPECVTVAQSRDPMRCAKGLLTAADYTYEDAGKLDYLLVPGGFAAFEEMKNEQTIAFIRACATEAKAVLSVCSGTFILLAAGLLEGVEATTNWKVIDKLREAGVTVIEERYVRDGRIWSSGGVSAGIDMTLALVAHEAGAEAAWITQYQAEYLPEGKLYGSLTTWQGAPAYARRLRQED